MCSNATLRALSMAVAGIGLSLAASTSLGTNGSWNVDASGNFSDPANWTPAVPSSGATATLGNVISANRQVTLDITPSLSGLVIDSGYAYIIAGPGALNLGGATIDVLRPAANSPSVLIGGSVISAPITGSGGLTKSGPGTVTLSNAANTYTGPTNILGGVLQVSGGSGGLSGGPINISNATLRTVSNPFTTTSPINISGNATIQAVNASTNLDGVISGSGNLIRSFGTSSNVLNLRAENTYTGNTIVRGGFLQLIGPDASIRNSPRIDVAGFFAAENSQGVNNDRFNANAQFISRGALLGFGASAVASSTHNVPTLTLASGRTELLTTAPTDTTNTVNIGNLDRQNRATLFLRGLNDNTSVVTVGNTLPTIGGGGSVGSTTQSIVPWMVANPTATEFRVNTTFVTLDGGRLRPLDVNSEYATSLNTALPTDNVRLAPLVGGAANPINVPVGGVTVNSLIVATQAATTNNVLTLIGNDPITITSGALNATPVNSLNSTIFEVPIHFGSAEGVLHNQSGVTITFARPISGSGGLTVGGTGLVAFRDTAVNTYTGVTTLLGGTVQINADVLPNQPGPFGNDDSAIVLGSSSLSVGSGASARILSNSPTGVVARPIVVKGDPLNPSVLGTTAPFLTPTANLTVNAPITLEGDLGIELGAAAAVLNLNGVISGDHLVRSVGTSQGIANFNAANTYTGGTETLNLQLFAGNNQAFGTGPIFFSSTGAPNANSRIGAAGAARTIANDVVLRNHLTVVGNFPLTITGDVNLGGGNIGAGGAPFNITVPGSAPLTLTGRLFDGGFNKTGVGILTLVGDSDYTGPTNVTAGTLRVINTTGSATGSGVVTVAANATLTGSGFIAGAVNLSDNAILAPGDAVGTLSVGSLSLVSSSQLFFDLGLPSFAESTSDLVVVAGNLVLDGVLTVLPLAGFGVGTYPLFTYGGSLTDNGLSVNPLPNNLVGLIDTNTTGVVNLVVIPEPASLSLLLLGGLALRRRRA